MKKGRQRFEFYLLKLETLLSKAAAEKNPALWLYSNDARTPLFMLEGLSKLYAGLHNEKKFNKLKDEFKLLEDALGAIDYYDGFAKEFDSNATIPGGVREYLHAQTREKIQRLNDLLEARKWISNSGERLAKIRSKLDEADWMKDEKEVQKMEAFYRDSIEQIKTFAEKTGFQFTEIETQAHALRRKLRWLSIYPQALQGVVQLTDSHNADDAVNKYLQPEIVNSPFNKMPDAGDNTSFLLLEKNYFLALSWMISALGKLKDSGLRTLILAEALQQTRGLKQEATITQAYELLGPDQKNLDMILSEASTISRTFFDEGNLDKILSGSRTAKTAQ